MAKKKKAKKKAKRTVRKRPIKLLKDKVVSPDKWNDDERILYSELVSLRSNEVNLRWTKNQIFFLIHSAGISLVVTQFKTGEYLYFFSCVVGIWFGVIWWQILLRAQLSIEYWDNQAKLMENEQRIKIFTDIEFMREKWRGMKLHFLLLCMSITITIVWLVLILMPFVNRR